MSQPRNEIRTQSRSRVGSVALVGAGPGDPDLLTVKALRALASADAILFDHLVSDGVLAVCPRRATMISVGKIGHGAHCGQGEINALMIALVRAGKRVVRLKAGDPMIFGRAGEEIEALTAAGIEVEIVPGISAMQAAAASLKVSLTHRARARRLQLITGHSHTGEIPDDLDWRALSDPATTTVVYMGKHWVGVLMARLVESGVEPSCPAAAVLDASRSSERIIRATVATLAKAIEASKSAAQCIILVGKVLETRHDGPAEPAAAIRSRARSPIAVSMPREVATVQWRPASDTAKHRRRFVREPV